MSNSLWQLLLFIYCGTNTTLVFRQPSLMLDAVSLAADECRIQCTLQFGESSLHYSVVIRRPSMMTVCENAHCIKTAKWFLIILCSF